MTDTFALLNAMAAYLFPSFEITRMHDLTGRPSSGKTSGFKCRYRLSLRCDDTVYCKGLCTPVSYQIRSRIELLHDICGRIRKTVYSQKLYRMKRYFGGIRWREGVSRPLRRSGQLSGRAWTRLLIVLRCADCADQDKGTIKGGLIIWGGRAPVHQHSVEDAVFIGFPGWWSYRHSRTVTFGTPRISR